MRRQGRGFGPCRPLLVVIGAALLLTPWFITSDADAATSWSVGLAASSKGEAQAQALPAAPTGVSAACADPTTSKTITITWSAVTHASAYAVYKATSTTSTPGSYSSVETGLTTTSWTTGTLTAGDNYWFKVVADIGTNWASAQSSATAESTINSSNPYCVQP